MPNRPIILAPWQVRAVQEGRLTQIRVPVVPQPAEDIRTWVSPNGTRGWISSRRHQHGRQTVHLPPFQPGDILYVREVWARWAGEYCPCSYYGYECKCPEFIYKADPDAAFANECEPPEDRVPWRSPATMPRAAARLFLPVEEVRVQKLGDATVEDIEAEGLRPINNPLIYEDRETALAICREEYARKWNARYARKGYPWDSNPWTFVGTVKNKQ